MRFHRRTSGLLMPDREMIPPGHCQLLATRMMMGAAGGGDASLYGAFEAIGKTANLIFALDVGDALSYGGSGQTWSDRSAAGNDFNRGLTSGSEAQDPTFNGTAGDLSTSTYWSFDGGDLFRLAAGSTPAAIEALHKTGAVWSGVCWMYPAGAAANFIMGDSGAGVANGMNVLLASGTRLRVDDGSSALATADTAVNTGAWNMLGWTMNTTSSFYYQNGAINQVSSSDTFNGSFTQSVNAAYRLEIGAGGNAASPLPSGNRLAAVAVTTDALTQADYDSVWNAMRARFGL